MQIERVKALSPESFLERYLIPNQPVIVVDAMDSWEGRTKWSPAYLKRELGDYEVPVYNDLFDLVSVSSLSDYLEKNFDRKDSELSPQYVRWFSRLKHVDFLWSDEAFARIEDDWQHPYFLPVTDYTIPYCQSPQKLSSVRSLFPYRGLFISGKGARTRLHRDPWTTSAILCQMYGSKKFILYAPDQSKYLMNGHDFARIEKPDLERFPNFHSAKPTYEDVLNPGEVLFIPSNWPHDVTCLTDSISVTWNFLHNCKRAEFFQHVAAYPSDKEFEVVRFFLSQSLLPDANRDRIHDLVGR